MTLDLEQLADQVQREHRARFKPRTRVKTHVPHGTSGLTIIPTCSRCGAVHDRYRDAARTKPASYCGPCAAAYARDYMRRRRATQRLTP